MRDGLNATGRPIVHSIEPFSIHLDPEQSLKVSNLWRIATDICGSNCALARADTADKWAPLAGPGGWNDPDMIAVKNPSPDLKKEGAVGDWGATEGTGMTVGENRVYFGLWAVMK